MAWNGNGPRRLILAQKKASLMLDSDYCDVMKSYQTKSRKIMDLHFLLSDLRASAPWPGGFTSPPLSLSGELQVVRPFLLVQLEF